MGEAIQALSPSVISVSGETQFINRLASTTLYLPIPCYPTRIVSVQASSFFLQYPFDIQIYVNTSLFYTSINNLSDIFDNPPSPIPVGGFFLTLDGVSEFRDYDPFTAPAPGVLSLTVLPALPNPNIPYLTVVLTNNSIGVDGYDVVLKLELLGKGYDESPVLFPGLGSSVTISSSNI